MFNLGQQTLVVLGAADQPVCHGGVRMPAAVWRPVAGSGYFIGPDWRACCGRC